jgi:hypothetical protein
MYRRLDKLVDGSETAKRCQQERQEWLASGGQETIGKAAKRPSLLHRLWTRYVRR